MALKSAQVSHDWPTVCRLFEATVRSTYGQSCPDFKIVVVCHELPPIDDKYDDRLEFIQADFAPPQSNEWRPCVEDKWKKLAKGMLRVKEFKPSFVMIMDADDLVSNRLVEFALGNRDENGWTFKTGYRWTYGSKWMLLERSRFALLCGTSAIVNARRLVFPTDTTEESVKQCIILRWGHHLVAEKMSEMGTPLSRLPFRGTIYVQSHRDNLSSIGSLDHSGRWRDVIRTAIRRMPNWRRCTAQIQREFSLQTCLR